MAQSTHFTRCHNHLRDRLDTTSSIQQARKKESNRDSEVSQVTNSNRRYLGEKTHLGMDRTDDPVHFDLESTGTNGTTVVVI